MKSYSDYITEGINEDKNVASVFKIAKKYGFDMSFGKFLSKKNQYEFIIEDDKRRNNDDYVIRISFDGKTNKFAVIVMCGSESLLDEGKFKTFTDYVNQTNKMIQELNKIFK